MLLLALSLLILTYYKIIINNNTHICLPDTLRRVGCYLLLVLLCFGIPRFTCIFYHSAGSPIAHLVACRPSAILWAVGWYYPSFTLTIFTCHCFFCYFCFTHLVPSFPVSPVFTSTFDSFSFHIFRQLFFLSNSNWILEPAVNCSTAFFISFSMFFTLFSLWLDSTDRPKAVSILPNHKVYMPLSGITEK